MTNRSLSTRFERGTRERRLLRSFEIGLTDDIALIDLDTRHDMVFYCDREGQYAIWCLVEDEDAWEDNLYEYSSYEEARKNFDAWSERELEPNWEAQAEYDELHGTINGEDPGVVAMRELWGEY